MSATVEVSPFTRWVVLAALSLATAVMFAVSLRGNFLFGYSIGQSEERRWLFGWANVAADVWKAFGLIAVTLLWRTKHRRAAVLASLAWFACLLFGINSALGIYVQDRAALIGTRAAKHATYTDVEKELAGVEAKLRGRQVRRGVAEIDAALRALLSGPVLVGERVRGTLAHVSHNCTKIDRRTKDVCQQVGALREERAGAVEAEKLEGRAVVLRRQIVTLRNRGDSVSADPVGEFYAWLTGGIVSVRDVGFGFPLFFALLIELVSAFGPATIATYAEVSASSSASPITLERAAAGHDALGHAAAGSGEAEQAQVLSWFAERAAPVSERSAIGIATLHSDYAEWCAEKGNSVGTLAVFEETFDAVRALPELAGKIRKFGDRYYGVGLAHRHVPRIGSRRSG